MAHIKLVPSWSYDYGEPSTRLIKRANGRRWSGEDRRLFAKNASQVFHSRIDDLLSQIKPGDVPLHVIALGSDERYGGNRNGDGFPESACEKYAWTFEKLACWYRSHKNKDPERRYGVVKAAAFNPEMSRIELVVFLNGTKEAANRNGGFVADEELEKLARNEDLMTSMSCKIAHDFCSGCGNKARNRAEYCGPDMCKYGGLRHNMGVTFQDGHQLRAINREPYFFDISYIPTRQADLTAYASRADYLKKSAEHFKSGETLAEEWGVTAPAEVSLAMGLYLPSLAGWTIKKADDTCERIRFARHLAAVESTLLAGSSFGRNTAAAGAKGEPLPIAGFPKIGSTAGSNLLRALTDVGVFLSPADFVTWLSDGQKDAALTERVEIALPGIYARLLQEDGGSAEQQLQKWALASPLDPAASLAVSSADRRMAFQLAASHSLFPESVWSRTLQKVAEGEDLLQPRKPWAEKQASDKVGSVEAETARVYALYKAASLHYLLHQRGLARQRADADRVVAYALWQQIGA